MLSSREPIVTNCSDCGDGNERQMYMDCAVSIGKVSNRAAITSVNAVKLDGRLLQAMPIGTGAAGASFRSARTAFLCRFEAK